MLILVICIFALILAMIGCITGVISLIEIKAINKSTHNFHAVPFSGKDQEWSTSEEAVEKYSKQEQKGIEEDFPEFYMDKDDYKKYSL